MPGRPSPSCGNDRARRGPAKAAAHRDCPNRRNEGAGVGKCSAGTSVPACRRACSWRHCIDCPSEREEPVTKTLVGKCFCGAVHYAMPDEFLYAMNCHCSNCRRTTGSAFKPFAGIERGKHTVTKGRDNLLIYGDDDKNDTHCKRCGSLLYSVVRD